MNAKQIRARAAAQRAKAERDRMSKHADRMAAAIDAERAKLDAKDPRRMDHTIKVALGRDTGIARGVVATCLASLDTLTEAERADVLRAVNAYYWRAGTP